MRKGCLCMLSYDEKKKIKAILSEGLDINENIRFSHFLESIDETNKKVKSITSKLDQIIRNQQILDQKLDPMIRRIG